MKRVLIVDDDKQIRESLKILMQKNNFEVILAANGQQAIEQTKQLNFSLIVTDIVMPDKDGLEVIMYIRKNFPQTPIIAMSGGGRFGEMDSYLKMANHLGAGKLFNKPFDLKEFIEYVNQIVAE